MHLIEVKIAKDNNTIKYIKMIREFDSSIPMGEIKKRIDSGEVVFDFDLDGNDWLYIENMTEYKWHRNFYKFLQNLIKNGAKLELIEKYEMDASEIHTETIDMKGLDRQIKFDKEISDEVDKYPD